MAKTPKGVEYEGPSGIGRDSMWLTAEDLVEGRDIPVKIERTEHFDEVEFQEGRARKNLLGLVFVGKERILGLNATNRKTLNRMFGTLVKGWKGKDIKLYVTEVMAFGEMVKCVRIRDTGARAATAAEDFLHGDDKEPKVK